MKKKTMPKIMEILELEEKVLSLKDDIESIFQEVKRLAGENDIIVSRSKLYWYNNIMAWVDGRNHYHTMMQVIKALREEIE